MDTLKIEEIKRAILRGEKEYEGYTLPTPQKSGTDLQKNAYALQSATNFWKRYFK